MHEIEYHHQLDLLEQQLGAEKHLADRQELLLEILVTADRVAAKQLEEPSHRD